MTLSAATSRGDVLWLLPASGSAGALEMRGVTITGIENGKISFRTPANTEASRDLAQVLRLNVDSEPALNAGEIAYSASQYDKATDEYLRFQRGTSKPWLKSYTAVRLMTAATRAGRFDATITAYIDLVQAAPRLAQENRPMLDASNLPKPGQLDAAIAEMDRAIARPTNAADQKQALLQLQLDLLRARGNTERAGKILEQLIATSSNAGSDPTAQKALADLRLSQALVAIDSRDYARAASTIDQYKAAFVDARQQAEALFVLAQAREGEARSGTDKAKLQDAALAYMRVVAHFRDVPSASARVPTSMFRAAKLLEDLGDKASARQLYQ